MPAQHHIELQRLQFLDRLQRHRHIRREPFHRSLHHAIPVPERVAREKHLSGAVEKRNAPRRMSRYMDDLQAWYYVAVVEDDVRFLFLALTIGPGILRGTPTPPLGKGNFFVPERHQVFPYDLQSQLI